MCEFKVFLESDGKRDLIAKNVATAKLKNGAVTLMDAAGRLTRVENARMVTIDMLTQELVLQKEA